MTLTNQVEFTKNKNVSAKNNFAIHGYFFPFDQNKYLQIKQEVL